ncbi:MAG TPA: sensor domain-containing diguanylate cyclase [Acidimicrobiales bacterium]|nr:sensor domain-containing diguanylate cyclase [Acidimicrobiales bacterium]
MRTSAESELTGTQPAIGPATLGAWTVVPLLLSIAIGAPIVLLLDVSAVAAWSIQVGLSLACVAAGGIAMLTLSPRGGDMDVVAHNAFAEEHAAELMRRAFDTEFDRALDMLDTEAAVLDMTRSALRRLDPRCEFELHLVDPTKPELCLAMSTVDTPPADTRDQPWSPWDSFAARQGQTITYETTDRLDVCPHLRSRIDGPSSAVCVPLIVMGRILGVLYAVGDVGVRTRDEVERIESLARRSALHIGLVRAATKTEPPEPVDSVTGLPEQRVARERLVKLSEAGTPFSLALVDIDHFAIYRELHGAEAADEALQLLSESLVAAVRPTDMVARVGDFEFAVVLPESTAQSALKAIERVREQLIIVQAMRPKPLFTCSFGLAHSSMSPSIDGIISLAATALDTAQSEGRNRVVIAGSVRTHRHPSQSGDVN